MRTDPPASPNSASEDADVDELPVFIAVRLGSCWQLCVPFWGSEGKMLVPTCGIAYGLKVCMICVCVRPGYIIGFDCACG